MNPYDYLNNTQDLSLPDWGPYARDFLTLSHIADVERGLRMDFLMVPGICKRKFCPPETLRECDYSPWEASADFSYYSLRQQMVDHDVYYAETSYSKIDDHFRLGRIEFVNRTPERQCATLLIYGRFAPRNEVLPQLPEGAVWMDALDYADLAYAHQRCDHNLVFNGERRAGQQDFPGTVGNRCLGKPFYDRQLPCFGTDAGDRVRYRLPAAAHRVLLRARLEPGAELACQSIADGAAAPRVLHGTGEFELYDFAGPLPEGASLEFVSGGTPQGLRIDGFVLLPEGADRAAISFPKMSRACNPHSEPGPVPGSAIITLDGASQSYAMWWDVPEAPPREYWTNDLAHLINYSHGLSHPYYKNFEPGATANYCKDVLILPIVIEANSTKVHYAIFGNGTPAELAALDRSPDALEACYQRAKTHAFQFNVTPAGEKYRFSQQLMSAAVMTNIAFPIQAKGRNIRHHTPDKYYYTLYSWDSGFIGLGLSEFDKIRAVENLNAYVTPPEDDECAFILHGTPVPVQAYLYAELWNRHQDRAMLEHFYPRVKHFYDFLAGHIPTSTFRVPNLDLIQGWDYFYNSGGWDDYPPQWQVYLDKRYDIAPVILTSHTIRTAKFLRDAAVELGGRDADVAQYDADIHALADGLQRHSWSEADQIFSYVVHDAQGNDLGFYRDPVSGANFNFGLDGTSPLIAGVCTPAQEKALFERMETPGRIWSPYGLSTVDMSAPYYRTDGYWNGCVWMPQQWFFWKAALDHRRGAFARRIATTALDLWKHEADQSYYCFEHFSLQNGRGCGCHHFGGLSSPVLCWHHAYYERGRLTGGFDLWVRERQDTPDGGIDAEIRLGGVPGTTATVLFVAGDGNWKAAYDGQPVPAVFGEPGCLEIDLPKGTSGTLRITRA